MVNCVGLDIGSSSIKLLEVQTTRKGTRLLNFGIEPLPGQTIVDGSIMDQSSVVEAIQKLKTALGIKNRNVATAVAGHSVIIKKIQVSPMSPDELTEQLQFEAEHHIPFKPDEVEIDHQLVNPRNAGGQMELMLVAAKKEVIADYSQVIREAKLQPVVMDVVAFALQNAFEANYEPPAAGAVALINIGAALTNVNIVHQGTSVFTRDVTVGGAAFTEEIQKRMSVSQEEAEAYKLGLALGGPGSVPPMVDKVVNEVADGVVGKLQRTLDFFLAANSDAKLAQIYLAGGSAKLPALARLLQQRAQVPVEAFDPFRRVMVDPAQFDVDFVRAHAPEAAVGVGLALRKPGDRT